MYEVVYLNYICNNSLSLSLKNMLDIQYQIVLSILYVHMHKGWGGCPNNITVNVIHYFLCQVGISGVTHGTCWNPMFLSSLVWRFPPRFLLTSQTGNILLLHCRGRASSWSPYRLMNFFHTVGSPFHLFPIKHTKIEVIMSHFSYSFSSVLYLI